MDTDRFGLFKKTVVQRPLISQVAVKIKTSIGFSPMFG
jgi:hypothetical protein